MKAKAVAKTLNGVSILSHFFCCFLPAVLSVIAMLTISGGVITMEVFGIPEYVHELMIYFSAIMLILGGVSSYLSWKIDCRKDGVCSHEPCKPKKMRYFRVYFFALAFFMLNTSIHFTLHT